MPSFDSIIVILILAVIVVEWWGVSRYLKWFRNFQLPLVNDLTLPRAAVILSIRGAASTLHECLVRLAAQNYPNYRIHLVVDHPDDPANEIIGNWLASQPRRPVSISFLEDPSQHAYLKTSAVLQAIRNLPDDVGVAVLADADTLAYPNWLKDLVVPTMSDNVGLVSGNRWYDPTSRSWGALVRFFYNAICVPPMYFMEATWGGSLAIKRDVFATPFFRERMTNTPCEDAALQASAQNLGLSVELQPDVMIFNGEPCSLSEAFDFFKRQLLWTRLYHPAWSILFAGTWVLHILLAGTLLFGVWHLAVGQFFAAGQLLGALAALAVVSQLFAERLHRTIAQRIFREQGHKLPTIDWPARCRMFVALPLAFVVVCYTMLAAALSRQVTWSGITYEVIPPSGLRLVEYLTIQEVHDRRVEIAQRPSHEINQQSPISSAASSVNPLIPPLCDNRFLTELIAEISGVEIAEVTRRFKQEHCDLGSNVRQALETAGIEPYVWSDAMAQFYAETDAFLYETLVWNRSALKNDMRRWIGEYLARFSDKPLRVLSFGDGLGIDAYYLAELGHDVTYFDVSQPCVTFARRIFDRGNLALTMLDAPEKVPADSFDVVLCLDVLEHVHEPAGLVGWLASLLREEGILVVHAPFHYIYPSVVTHLRSNTRYSGDLKSLYEHNGLYPIDGQIFWNPLVLQKTSSETSRAKRPPWRVRMGGVLLKTGRYWPAPHIAVGRMLLDQKKLAAMVE